MQLKKGEILSKILKDREQRFALRQAMAERGLSSISLNFNIAGYPKSSSELKEAFLWVKKDLLHYFTAHRIHCAKDSQLLLHSDCGDFFLQGVTYVCEPIVVKNLLETFEQEHPLNRLLDVDLYTAEQKYISSGKAKKCLLCDEAAHDCIQQERHSYNEFRSVVKQKIDNYLLGLKEKFFVSSIAEKALKATLFEVAVEHKPGLVCPSGTGAHQDMDYFTFLSSSAALTNYWQQTASYGFKMGQKEVVDYKKIRTHLRILGLEAEKTMFYATQGVNTQKGIIFLIGLGCFASGMLFAKEDSFQEEPFRQTIRNVMRGVVEEDLEKGYAKEGTHGEKVFKTYGKELAGGARQEAEEGFPTVFDYALDFIEYQIRAEHSLLKQEDWQEVLINLLLLIVSKSNDVNILYRKNVNILSEVQCKAARVLTITQSVKKYEALKDFSKYCVLNGISSGGAADLLALSLFVFFIKNLKFSVADASAS